MVGVRTDLLDDWNKIWEPYFKKNKRFDAFPPENADFSSFKTFKDFCKMNDGIYKIKEGKCRNGRSKNSERFFRLFLYDLLKDSEIQIPPKIPSINLEISGRKLEKKYDVKIEKKDKIILVDIKKNIDMIEKDLFKAMMLREHNNVKNNKILIFVWEEWNQSEDRHEKKGSCYTLLKFARTKRWIDNFVYFYPYKTEDDYVNDNATAKEDFEDEKQRLKNFLSNGEN